MAIDGSGRAPSLAHRSQIDPATPGLGYKGTTVPSLPATYWWLHQHHGRLDWPTILEPAIRIAREGYAITGLQHDLQRRELDNLLAVEGRSGARYFLYHGKEPFPVGAVFRQPDLAATLEVIAVRGIESFYRGDIAHQIDADMRAHEGFLRADDLALIPWPVERKPLARRYRGLLIKTMPPPGAGRTLLLVLMMLTLLATYHTPYHEALERAAAAADMRLCLDCHSMSDYPPPIAPDASRRRPLFCLSNADGKTCSQAVLDALASALGSAFGCGRHAISANDPFKGGYITRRHGAGQVPWIQVEMNRSLYLAEPWFDRERLTVDPERLAELKERFAKALRSVASHWSVPERNVRR